MSNWVEKFKNQVISSQKLHSIVADTDNLLEYSELKDQFEKDGYRIIKAKTNLETRVWFELEVRDSETKCLLVAPADYYPLPDIQDCAYFQKIGLNNLFTNLDAKAIKGLSFNALCLLSEIKPYEELGNDKTLKFLLENLFNVDFESLANNKTKERILNVLITVIFGSENVNKSVLEYLKSLARPVFPQLVEQGFTKENLLSFLQEQWIIFTNQGQPLFNFNDSIISKNVGFLFAQGLLKPVNITKTIYEAFPNPLKLGVIVNEQGEKERELEGFIEYIDNQSKLIEDQYNDWFEIIQVIAKAKLLCLQISNSELTARFLKLENDLNKRFQRFIDTAYASLFSLSGVIKPVVVSRILDHIKSDPATKKALIVIDGMNFWQWNILAKELVNANIPTVTKATLAYIPTITAWSRQAIFRGGKPNLDEGNAKENQLFSQYWEDNGLSTSQVKFLKMDLSRPNISEEISEIIKIVGLVCNDLDEIMHGTILGDEQLKTSTEHWIRSSQIVAQITELRNKGFKVYITADHGNIEAVGLGNLKLTDKLGTLTRSKRFLNFDNEILLNSFLEEHKDLNIGKKGLSAYLKEKGAFTNENQKIITHGGSHFWEVLIPFISINEK